MGVRWQEDPDELAWWRDEANTVRRTTNIADLPAPERDTPTPAEAARDEQENP